MVLETLERRASVKNRDERYVFSNHRSTCVVARAKKAAAVGDAMHEDGAGSNHHLAGASSYSMARGVKQRPPDAPFGRWDCRVRGLIGRTARSSLGVVISRPSCGLPRVGR